jgi:sugar/nucleoside kinase (ribokinase family)
MSILVVGDANADLTATLSRFPGEGDDSPVRALSWGSGGSAANVAAALARLATPARLLARVGSDPAAEIALRVARAAGVDLSSVQIDQTLATGLCYAAISPGGERTFLSYRGANQAMQPPQSAALHEIEWLHIAGHALLEDTQADSTLMLLAATEQPASLDLCLPLIGSQRARILALLPRFAIVFANERELWALHGADEPIPHALRALCECAVAQQAQGIALLVVKCGARGCIVVDHEGARYVPAFPVRALDTNGCGDAFVAGFLAGWLRAATPQNCALRGNALGGLAATRHGAAESLPDIAEVEALLAGSDAMYDDAGAYRPAETSMAQERNP